MIAFASDHVGLSLKIELMEYVKSLGYECKDYGTFEQSSCDYPRYAFKAASAVSGGECEKGILVCGTGVGISLAANKVKGIRCVVCTDCYSAKLSGEHNNTNMLALGARVIGSELAKMIVKSWFEGKFEGGRHKERVDMITAIEDGVFTD